MSGPLRIEVSDLAERQIQKADRWWRDNRLKAPNAIREELERIGIMIALRPQLGAKAVNVRCPEFDEFTLSESTTTFTTESSGRLNTSK